MYIRMPLKQSQQQIYRALEHKSNWQHTNVFTLPRINIIKGQNRFTTAAWNFVMLLKVQEEILKSLKTEHFTKKTCKYSKMTFTKQ